MVVNEIIPVELFRRVLGRKFTRRLIAGEVDDERSVTVRGENFLGIFPARQIKLPAAKRKVRNPARRQLLLKMSANKAVSAP